MARGPGETERRRFGLARPFDTLALGWLGIAAVLLCGVIFGLGLQNGITEAHFFKTQDMPVLAACFAIVVALGAAPQRLFGRLRPSGRRGRLWLGLLTAAVFAAGAVGSRWLFGGYTLSLDEFLANFDARIFASGRLLATIPPAWRDFGSAMQPMYILPLPDDVWASEYLPVNAALRALASKAGAEDLVNPLLSAVSIPLTYAVAGRLWPGERRLALIAAALLGTSAQLILMSMTAYAMPGHLAFDLAWLWLFLRGGRLGHAGALATGFLATGLHQLLFHPMFAAPFVLQLWLDRRWRLAAVYTAAYAAIGVFWIEYPALAMSLSHVAADPHAAAGGGRFLERAMEALQGVNLGNFGLMAEGLVRFATWQNPLTAPLLCIGAPAALLAKGHLRALLLGVVLTVVVMSVLVPSQTHGWGYRYLHGLLGSIALIAAWTWRRLTAALAAPRRAMADGAMALACAVSILGLVPVRAWQAWAFVRPYAAANAAVQGSGADVVIIDHESSLLFDKGTLTRNDPFLAHGPKVMALADMDADLVRELCAQHLRVVMFTGADAKRYGIDVMPWNGPTDVAQLRTLLAQLGCAQPMPR
ncbi:MAG TPA: hypothetical protein VGG29_14955 [Caulobacteraceae bacterium]|jgi:hypothetical protein